MPVISKHLQSKFTFTTGTSGLPLADIFYQSGSTYYCCPLCGCIHQLRRAGSLIVQPNCLLPLLARQDTPAGHWRKLYGQWLKRFPQAAQYQRVQLCRTRKQATKTRRKRTAIKAPVLTPATRKRRAGTALPHAQRAA